MSESTQARNVLGEPLVGCCEASITPKRKARCVAVIALHALVRFGIDTKMNLKLNSKQSEHVAVSLRTYGIGQMAAFGYAAVQVGHWFVGAVSFIALLLCEASALWFLKSTENNDE